LSGLFQGSGCFEDLTVVKRKGSKRIAEKRSFFLRFSSAFG
jgi:hypothetical protein